MSYLEELLAPIGEEAPTGPDLRGTNEFAAIERAFMDADQPAVSMPGGAAQEIGEEYQGVVALCVDFLENQSKDLKVAVYLAASLLRVEGFSGLATGLEVIKGLLEGYWEGLHPPIPNRAPILDWFGSEDLSYALYLVPLTEFGHRHAEYKKWVKEEAEKQDGSSSGEEQAGGGQGFGSGFGQTSREWYEGVVSALHRCSATLDALDTLGKERFSQAREKPPRYPSLADALKRLTSAAEDLLGRKPAPPRPVEPESPLAPEGAGGGGDAAPAGSSTPPGSTQASVFAEPRTAAEAAALVAVAARVMRRLKPWDPSPYLLLRGLRWGELRAGGDPVDPRVLEAPTTGQRTHMKGLFLDKKWAELLEAGEEIMATPGGRGWIDLQRYSVMAAERLGSDFRQVADAVRSGLSSLLKDLPTLPDASLMDDSPTASRDTMSWLREAGLLPAGGTPADRPEEDSARPADRIIRDGGFDRATAMARGGDPQGAVELLMERAQHERSQRARFIAKSEAASIMVSHGMALVARPILDELMELIDQHRLENWETPRVVAKPMGLLIRCLQPEESSVKDNVYPRLAKLDPLLAMEVERREGGGDPGSMAPSEPEG